MADNKEIGRIGQRRYGGVIYEEFLHELRGKRGIEAYREMSENDDVVGAILFAIEMLVRQTDWNVEPGGDSQADIDAAEFVESCMNDMQNTWIDTISEILSFLTFGWSEEWGGQKTVEHEVNMQMGLSDGENFRYERRKPFTNGSMTMRTI